MSKSGGFNYSKRTNMVASGKSSNYDGYYTYKSTLEYESDIKFSYALEGGLIINNSFTIGLRYNNLNEYKYKLKSKNDSGSSGSGKMEYALPISNLTLSFGILF